MALLHALDDATFRRVEGAVRVASIGVFVVAGLALIGSWQDRLPDGTGSAAVLVAALWYLGWISVRARLDPANAGRDWSVPQDDGYRGPLEPPRSRKQR